MDLKENTNQVFQQVTKAITEAGREDGSVSVIAVTKYVDIATAANLIDQGVKHIGENRVDKFLEKYHALSDKDVTWHLIGSLQRRKDVYKRQLQGKPLQSSFQHEYLLCHVGNQDSSRSQRPVSYTHLDVYKRQGYLLFEEL